MGWRGVSLSKAKAWISLGSGRSADATMPGRAEEPGVKLIQLSGGAMVVRGGGKLILWGWSEAVGGVKRIGEEGVLDVGGSQLEVLLLVLEAEDDARCDSSSGGQQRRRSIAASTWRR